MKLALFVFSLLSRFVCRIKNLLYDRGVLRALRAPLPVISVGNISLGGTEKTPLAMELLGRLLALGRRPVLVSRGYKGRWEKTGGVVSDGRAILGTWQEAGDEPFLVARALPAAGVYVGKNRLSSCREAAQAGFDIAVLDDGFQHRRLARDLDIVLYSPEEKVALREPVSALRRSDILLVKSGPETAGAMDRLRGYREESVFTYSVVARKFVDLRTGEPASKEALAGKRFLAFCGIARPHRFSETLRRTGLEVVSFLPFPDHHPYPQAS
jgi:tetraacyldisaccharide 4'-kinase